MKSVGGSSRERNITLYQPNLLRRTEGCLSRLMRKKCRRPPNPNGVERLIAPDAIRGNASPTTSRNPNGVQLTRHDLEGGTILVN